MTKKILSFNTNTKPRSFFILLFVVIVLCLLFQWNLTRYGVVLKGGGDTPSYEQAAKNILHGKFFHPKRPPLYPLFLIATQWGGDMLTLIAQRFLELACPIMIYIVIYKLLGSSVVAAIFAVLSFMYYDNYVYLDYKLTEPLARFLVTFWATFLILNRQRLPKFIWMSVIAVLLVACKAVFWPVLLATFVFTIITRALPWHKGIVVVVCFAVIPLWYSFQNYQIGNGFNYAASTIGGQCCTLTCDARYNWRIQIYPWNDPDIREIKLMLEKAQKEERTGELGVVGKIFVPRFAKIKGISNKESSDIFQRVYPKIFLTSLLLKPHRHVVDFFYTVTASMDRVGIPPNESSVAKFRRWIRYSIEYLMGGIFVLSVFACIFLFYTGLRNSHLENRSSRALLSLFLFFFLSAIYIIAGPSRYRIPIHDAMLLTTFWGMYEVLKWWGCKKAA